MPEILDIYDDSLTHLGTKARPAVHQDGDWHKVFHCWVAYRDDTGDDHVLFQKRGENASTFPGYLDTSAAGHYEAGEVPRDGLRELREELGLTPAFTDLIPAGRRVSMTQYKRLTDREVADVFVYICKQPLSVYDYAQDEIAGLIAVNVTHGLELLTGQRDRLRVAATGLADSTVTIQRTDFIPTPDNYFERALLLARRCLNHETYLFI